MTTVTIFKFLPILNCSSKRLSKALISNYSTKMDYSKYLTDFSKRREPSVLRELANLIISNPDCISFGTGMPNPSTFPFADISVTLKDGTNFSIKGRELDSALQYQPSTGYGQLREFLHSLMDNSHGPLDWTKRNVLITNGSLDGISRAVDMMLNTGDPVIIQHPVYSGIESMLRPYEPDYILAEQDSEGINPQQLREKLEKRKLSGSKMPKVIYVNPTAANPTGTLLPIQRRKELYKLAQDYDLIILEDDAYYYLHFLDKDPESFLSMDVDYRVMRFDSFSKILSSGLRLGVVTAPNQLLRQIELHIQASYLHPSSVSQVLACELLRNWGPEKLQNHFKSVRNFYLERRDIMLAAVEKHLTGLAEWTVPKGGMFLWIRVPAIPDTDMMVMKRGRDQKILLVPGRFFNADTKTPSSYIRAAYSLASAQEIEEGTARLAKLIRDEIQINKSNMA